MEWNQHSSARSHTYWLLSSTTPAISSSSHWISSSSSTFANCNREYLCEPAQMHERTHKLHAGSLAGPRCSLPPHVPSPQLCTFSLSHLLCSCTTNVGFRTHRNNTPVYSRYSSNFFKS